MMSTHTSPTPAPTRACGPARAGWTLRTATIAVLVFAAAVITGSATASAQPPTSPSPPAPAPVVIVTPPVQPAVPGLPSMTLPASPSPSPVSPNPGTPHPITPNPPTPGPATPKPAVPDPAYPGGGDQDPAIPAPTTPDVPGDTDPSTPATPDSPGGQQPGCGLTNITGCVSKAIDGWFHSLVTSALNPLLNMLSSTLLATPDPRALPQIGALWNSSWQLVLVIYGLVVMAAGVLLMAHQTLQTRWSARELAPRLVIGFLAGAFSMLIATAAIQVANALAHAVGGDGVDPDSTATTLRQLAVSNDPQAGTFVIMLEVALVVMLTIVLISYVVRVVITILLIVGAPLALMCHALPGAESIARWWWRSFASVLAIQVVQSLILVTVLRVLLTPGGWAMFSPHTTGMVDRIIALGLMAVLAKTPFWLLSTLKIGHGRTLPESVIRSYISYKTLGLLKGSGASTATAAQTTTAPRRNVTNIAVPRRPGASRSSAAGAADPYAKVRATRDGQLMLPLEGVHKVPRTPSPAPTPSTTPQPTARRAPQGRQLAFDFRPPDPYRGIRAGRDGQYALPIPVTRAPKANTTAAHAPASAPRTRTPVRARGTQLAFDFPPPDPYARNRPMRNGQYPLPIRVARIRTTPQPGTPPQPASPVPAASPSSRGRQLHLPLPDLPVRRRSPKGGSR